MARHFLHRLLLTLPALWLVLTLVFLLIHIVPGDPVEQMLGEGAAPGQIEQLRHTISASTVPSSCNTGITFGNRSLEILASPSNSVSRFAASFSSAIPQPATGLPGFAGLRRHRHSRRSVSALTVAATPAIARRRSYAIWPRRPKFCVRAAADSSSFRSNLDGSPFLDGAASLNSASSRCHSGRRARRYPHAHGPGSHAGGAFQRLRPHRACQRPLHLAVFTHHASAQRAHSHHHDSGSAIRHPACRHHRHRNIFPGPALAASPFRPFRPETILCCRAAFWSSRSPTSWSICSPIFSTP